MMISTKKEMALIKAGVRQLEQKMQAIQKENRRLKAKLRLKNLDRELSLRQAGEIAGKTKSTIHYWKKDGLRTNTNGKVMYSDLIAYMANRYPDRVRQLGFNPENFNK